MRKKNIYNLNEDEELTHYGQSLADIEKHHDIVDSDSDAEDRGALSGEGGVGTVRPMGDWLRLAWGPCGVSLGRSPRPEVFSVPGSRTSRRAGSSVSRLRATYGPGWL